MADETVYRDPTPVGKKEEVLKTSNLRQPTTKYVAYIRSKEYGVDVRESIARGIEAIQYNTDEQAREIKAENDKSIKNLKKEVVPIITQDVINEVGKVNPSAELINSRNDTVNKKQYASLSLRLNAMSEKTNENEKSAEGKFQTPKITGNDGGTIFSWNDTKTIAEYIKTAQKGLTTGYMHGNITDAPTTASGRLLMNIQQRDTGEYGYGWVQNINYQGKFYWRSIFGKTLGAWKEVADVGLAQMGKVTKDDGTEFVVVKSEESIVKALLSLELGLKTIQIRPGSVGYPEGRTRTQYLRGTVEKFENARCLVSVVDDVSGDRYEQMIALGTAKDASVAKGWNIQRNWVTIFVGERGLTNKETATFTKTGVIKSIRVSSSHTETVEYLDITKDSVDYLQQWNDNTSSSSIISPNASTNTLTVRHVTGAFGIKIRKIEVCLV